MARGRANCTCATCGASFEVVKRDFYNSKAAREWEEWAERTFDECEECKIKNAKEQAKVDAENGMPELKGSDKQCAWAITIRSNFLYAFKNMENDKSVEYSDEEFLKLARSMRDWVIKDKVSASWWIDHRNHTGNSSEILSLFRSLAKEYNEYAERAKQLEEIAKPTDETVKQAISEAMIKPECETSKAVVEINITADAVKAVYDRDNDFIKVMHSIDWSWSSEDKVWQKRINSTSGSAEDRAAEAGNALLRAGFPVIIWNDEAREMAVNATFKPEVKRWICYLNSETLTVHWEYGNNKLYQTIKALSGAKYDSGRFRIPIRQWKALLDVTDGFGFSITPKASELIAQYKAAEDGAAMAAPVKPDAQPMPNDGLKAILKSSSDVLPDLRDD